jgi:hypothetical protein
MKASGSEYRHPTLVRQLIIAAAFLTYLFDHDDIVWRFIKESPQPRFIERGLFAVATLLIGAAAAIRTWTAAYPDSYVKDHSARVASEGTYRYMSYPQYLADLFYAVGLGSLAPLSGFVILVAGEAVRIFRLIRRAEADEAPHTELASPKQLPNWKTAFREEAGKWGIFLTMIVFTLSLKDRVAEILAAATVLLWFLLNSSSSRRLTARR